MTTAPTTESALEALPVFDENAVCFKCWGTDIKANYQENTSHYGCPLARALGTSYGPEHIVRTCQRCHYTWEERVFHETPTDGCPRSETPKGCTRIEWNARKLTQVGWRSRTTGMICDCPVYEVSPHADSDPVWILTPEEV